MKARPMNVLELHVEKVRGGAGVDFVQSLNDGLAAGDPEHVETAQRVNGRHALLQE